MDLIIHFLRYDFMNEKEIRILKKIRDNEYDDEVQEFVAESLQWYINHADELID